MTRPAPTPIELPTTEAWRNVARAIGRLADPTLADELRSDPRLTRISLGSEWRAILSYQGDEAAVTLLWERPVSSRRRVRYQRQVTLVEAPEPLLIARLQEAADEAREDIYDDPRCRVAVKRGGK